MKCISLADHLVNELVVSSTALAVSKGSGKWMDSSVKKAMQETLMANASKLAHHNAVEEDYQDIVAHIAKKIRKN